MLLMLMQNTLTMPMCFSFFLMLTEWRYSRRKTLLLASLTAALLAVVNIAAPLLSYHFGLPSIYLKIVSPLWNLAAVCFAFLRLSKYKDVGTLFIALSAILLSLNTLIFSNLLKLITDQVVLILAVKLLCYALLVPFVLRCLRGPLIQLRAYLTRRWVPLCLLPLSLILALFLLLVYPTNMYQYPENLPAAVVLSLGSLVFCWLISTLFRQLRFQSQQDDDALVMQLLTEQVEIFYQNEERLKIFRHDLRHYTRIVEEYLAKEDMDGARQVLSSIPEHLLLSTDMTTPPRYTGHAVVDTVLSYYTARAAQERLDFSVRLELDALSVNPLELAVVISNLLENAEHAAAKLPDDMERAVRLVGGRNGKQFFLELSNTYAGPIRFHPDSNLPVTDAFGHGYGTRSIVAFVRKYDGVLDCHAENGWFILRILI